MTSDDLKLRTKKFALGIIHLMDHVAASAAGRVISRQLIRSSTSVGANYRAACRARSRAEFAAKIGIAEEEADESAYWIELLKESGLLPEAKANGHLREANEITRIMAASRKTARSIAD